MRSVTSGEKQYIRYATIATVEQTVIPTSRKGRLYPSNALRKLFSPMAMTYSPRRLAKPKMSASRNVKIISHCDTATPVTAPPAKIRNRNHSPISDMSIIAMCLSENE